MCLLLLKTEFIYSIGKKYARIGLCLPWSWNVVPCFIGLDLNPMQANFRSCTRVHINPKIIVKSQRDFVSNWSLKMRTSVTISTNNTCFLFWNQHVQLKLKHEVICRIHLHLQARYTSYLCRILCSICIPVK